MLAGETFHTVARVGDIPEGQGRYFEVDGRMIAVFLDNGTYYAVDDFCPHQGLPLSDGTAFNKTVTCAWHGWSFSLEDGHHTGGTQSRVPVYPVRVVGEDIQVGVE
jgi:nitrite reductase/ring-hydroxylating ferredoxin subunit